MVKDNANDSNRGKFDARTVKFSLLENAQDFLIESLSKAMLAEESHAEWKFAIFHASQAIELSLKEKLRIEHRALVYCNIEKPKRTVGPLVALERLRRHCGLRLSRPDMDAVEQAVKWRHQIVHYGFSLDVEQAKSVFAVLLSFLLHFHEVELGTTLSSVIPANLMKEALSIREYGNQALARAQARMQNEGIPESSLIVCPRCGLKTMAKGQDTYSCYACGHSDDIAECEICNGEVPCGELIWEDSWISEEESLPFARCKNCLRTFEPSDIP